MWVSKTLFACAVFLAPIHHALAGPLPIDLGTAAPFAILAGVSVGNTGASTADGNVGVWPGATVTGFPPGIVTNGSLYVGDTTAMLAEADASSAYQAALGEAGALALTGSDLGGMDLTPGVYAFATSAQLTGTLTLNAEGLSNTAFIFLIGSTLTTASNAVVQMTNLGTGDQVFWQIGSSATLGGGTAFIGDIVALTSITLNTGAGITCGSAVALNGTVTLVDGSISTTGAACTMGGPPVAEPASFGVLLAGLAAAATLKRGRLWGKPA